MGSVRSQWLDNAKGLLIIAVIWGHLIEPLALADPLSAGVYGAIYLFHMPAFALVSGMLSRPALGPRGLFEIGAKLLLPLLAFQILYGAAMIQLAPHRLAGDILTPHWLLWFLLSLGIWRIMLPFFLRLTLPVTTAIALALAAGFFEGIDTTLSLSRTFVFFPAFLIGHVHRDRIERMSATAHPLGALLFLVLLGASAHLIANGLSVQPLYGSQPYSIPDNATLVPALTRLLVIAAGLAATVAFLSLVPRQGGVLAWLGRLTLPVFLLHGFLVLLIWQVIPHVPRGLESAMLGLSGSIAIAIAFGLAFIADLPAAGRTFRKPG